MYLVTYDISSDRLRNKLAKMLLNYGRRVQYSVFECDISPKKYKEMYSEMVLLTIEQKEVSIRIYVLDKGAEKHTRVIGDPNYISLAADDDIIFV